MQWLIDIIVETVLNAMRGTRFLVYRHDSAQSVGSGAWRRVYFNDVEFDTKSEWNQPQHRLEVADSGYYQVSFSVGFRPTVGVNKKFIVRLLVNSAFVSMSMNQSSHNDYLSACSSILIHMNAGDELRCECYHNSGFNVNLDYTSDLTYLSVERVP